MATSYNSRGKFGSSEKQQKVKVCQALSSQICCDYAKKKKGFKCLVSVYLATVESCELHRGESDIFY